MQLIINLLYLVNSYIEYQLGSTLTPDADT